MEDEILSQDIEEDEDELKVLEEEEEEELKQKQTIQSKKKVSKQTQEQSEEVRETYEAFIQHARMGIANTLTGETIEGFDVVKDQAIVTLGKVILNKLDKIAIASGV